MKHARKHLIIIRLKMKHRYNCNLFVRFSLFLFLLLSRSCFHLLRIFNDFKKWYAARAQLILFHHRPAFFLFSIKYAVVFLIFSVFWLFICVCAHSFYLELPLISGICLKKKYIFIDVHAMVLLNYNSSLMSYYFVIVEENKNVCLFIYIKKRPKQPNAIYLWNVILC